MRWTAYLRSKNLQFYHMFCKKVFRGSNSREMFDGMSRVKKQQSVYAPLMEYIADNRIHALSIKAFTPQEWARDRKLNGF